MTVISSFYMVSCVLAVAHGAQATDLKLLEEEALELSYPHRGHPFAFDFRSVEDPTFETSFDLTSPPLLPLDLVRETRTRHRQRPSGTSGGGDGNNRGRGSSRNSSGSRNNGRSSGRGNSSNSGKSNRNNNKNWDSTDTNELTNGDEDLLALLFRDDYNNKRIAFLREQQRLEDVRNFYNVGEIRKKREATPEPGKLRRKRAYCRKCGGSGGYNYGGYHPVPVHAVAVPIYSGGYGGHGGRHVQRPYYGSGGCNTCGYPGFGGGGGGGFSGSYSHSQSQSSSSSGSWGYGKK